VRNTYETREFKLPMSCHVLLTLILLRIYYNEFKRQETLYGIKVTSEMFGHNDNPTPNTIATTTNKQTTTKSYQTMLTIPLRCS